MANILYPKSCPLHFDCSKAACYKNVVDHIRNNQSYFLNNHEELRKVACNCPHKIEAGYWAGVVSDNEWLLYLRCDVFSKWFWKGAITSATPVGER